MQNCTVDQNPILPSKSFSFGPRMHRTGETHYLEISAKMAVKTFNDLIILKQKGHHIHSASDGERVVQSTFAPL